MSGGNSCKKCGQHYDIPVGRVTVVVCPGCGHGNRVSEPVTAEVAIPTPSPPPKWAFVVSAAIFVVFLGCCGFCGISGYLGMPTEEERLAKAQHAKTLSEERQSREAQERAEAAAKQREEEAAKKLKLQACVEQFKSITKDVSLINSVATLSHGELVIAVENSWHYEPKAIRLQAAQNIGKIWKECDKVWNGDFTIRDLNGNEVGGRGFSGVWVAD